MATEPGASGRRRALALVAGAMLTLQAPLAVARQTPADNALWELLDRSGARIEEFWGQYSRVTSSEEIRQLKWADGDPVADLERSYDTLMVMELTGSTLRVEESRIERGEPVPEPDTSLLATSGFSTLLLIFHPYFRTGFEFSMDPADADGLREVGFRAIPGERSPSVLRLHGRNYPIAWNGRAWIEDQTGRIVRIEARLKEPMEDLGLAELTARTEYGRERLGDENAEYWLPVSATIEARSPGNRWRNEHRFTDYRLFSVESELELSGAPTDPTGEERR